MNENKKCGIFGISLAVIFIAASLSPALKHYSWGDTVGATVFSIEIIFIIFYIVSSILKDKREQRY